MVFTIDLAMSQLVTHALSGSEISLQAAIIDC